MSWNVPIEVVELYNSLRARQANCQRNADSHPDLATRISAKARAETYGILMMDLKVYWPALSRKESNP